MLRDSFGVLLCYLVCKSSIGITSQSSMKRSWVKPVKLFAGTEWRCRKKLGQYPALLYSYNLGQNKKEQLTPLLPQNNDEGAKEKKRAILASLKWGREGWSRCSLYFVQDWSSVWEGKMKARFGLCCDELQKLRTTRSVPHEKKIPESHIINLLLTKLVRPWWNKELGQHPAIFTPRLINNPYIKQDYPCTWRRLEAGLVSWNIL